MQFTASRYFLRATRDFLSDPALQELKQFLCENPDAGAVIADTGGARKLRWRRPGMGKRGGLRIVYAWRSAEDRILLLAVYAKGDYDDLPRTWIRAVYREILDGER